MSSVTTKVYIEQHEFEIYAAMAISLTERIKVKEKEINSYHKNNRETAAQNVSEAYDIVELKQQKQEMQRELRQLAMDMAHDGMPMDVFVRYDADDHADAASKKKKSYKIKLQQGGQDYILLVSNY